MQCEKQDLSRLVHAFHRASRTMSRSATLPLLAVAVSWVGFALPARAAEPRLVPVVPDLPVAAPIDDDRLAELDKAYGDATRLYEAKDLAGALDRADVVYRINPNASTALLRAQLLGELKHPCEAFAALLPGMDMKPGAEERAELTSGLSRHGRACNERLGWTRLEVSPTSTTVTVAGADVPLNRTIGLPKGTHSLELTAPGHARLRTSLTIRTGEEAVARYDLSPVAKPIAAPAPPKPRATPLVTDEPPPTESVEAVEAASSSTLGWVLTGSGAALLAGSAGMTLWALDAKDEGNSYKSPQPGLEEADRKERYDQAQTDLKTRGAIAVAMLATGTVATIWGVIELLDDGPADPAAWTLAPAWTPDGAGLSLRGGF